MAGADTNVKVTFSFEVKRVVITNLIEQELGYLEISGRTIELNIGQIAIETLKLMYGY